ncbi:BRO-N domain-containing protein [Enterobacter bugandensis]|uniref:BRO family protein n=1 Tax=Enterobacter bugandensis TaxID=881260 RepID=A0AA42PRE1_9ENTR|nr:BRO family protein [Enterobacter bugandensis]MDH1318563.1 BRO family protein [Enterobacter bugandensis]
MNTELTFRSHTFTPAICDNKFWLTSSQIAEALEYSSTKSITNLYNQNEDEFTSEMTQVTESVTSGNYRKKVRIFSLRGAHLIAMFARTPVAKEFRRWVLDVLDKEVLEATPQVNEVSARQNYAVITYFENGLPVACHPLMPGEVVMNPDSCLEHVIRSGYVVMPCDEVEKFTLGEIHKMITIARRARDRWMQP